MHLMSDQTIWLPTASMTYCNDYYAYEWYPSLSFLIVFIIMLSYISKVKTCVQFSCNIILNAHCDCAAKLFCMACRCADYKQSNNIWFECCLFCLTFQQQGERLILCVDATCGYGNWQQHEDLGTVQLLYLSCTKINVYYNDKTCNMITKWYDITAGYETEQNLHRWALRFVPWIFLIFYLCVCVSIDSHESAMMNVCLSIYEAFCSRTSDIGFFSDCVL